MSHLTDKLLTIALLLIASSAHATTYYVSPDGHDGGPGTTLSPWRTLQHAASSVKAGDTVIVAGGTYRGPLVITRSGTPGKPITFRAEPGASVIIRAVDSITAIWLRGTKYVTVEGFTLTRDNENARSFKYVALRDASHNVVRDIKITPSSDTLSALRRRRIAVGISIFNSHNNLIESNIIRGVSGTGITLNYGSSKNTIARNLISSPGKPCIRVTANDPSLKGNLIVENTLENSLTADGIQTNPPFSGSESSRKSDIYNRGLIIRRNTIRSNAENAIDLKGASVVLVEGNELSGSRGDNSGSLDNRKDRRGGSAITVGKIEPGVRAGTSHVIVRNNIVFDNRGGLAIYDGWYVYNNTILGNNRDYTGPNSSFYNVAKPMFVGAFVASGISRGAAFKNNILGGHRDSEASFVSAAKFDSDYNLFYGRTPRIVWKRTGKWRNNLSDLASWAATSGKDQHSMRDDSVLFNNAPITPISGRRYDFSLQRGSAAIDSGGPLTITVSSGSGTGLRVKDAGYFFDGFGSGEAGDIILVGGQQARVVKTDLAANTIHIDRSIRWDKDTPVYLAFEGGGPDIGASNAASGKGSGSNSGGQVGVPSNLTIEITR